jgi:hypothetical protein
MMVLVFRWPGGRPSDPRREQGEGALASSAAVKTRCRPRRYELLRCPRRAESRRARTKCPEPRAAARADGRPDRPTATASARAR